MRPKTSAQGSRMKLPLLARNWAPELTDLAELSQIGSGPLESAPTPEFEPEDGSSRSEP